MDVDDDGGVTLGPFISEGTGDEVRRVEVTEGRRIPRMSQCPAYIVKSIM